MATKVRVHARVSELEEALRAIETLTTQGDDTSIDRLANILYLARHVREGGTLGSANVTVKKRNMMSGKIIDVPLGTPLCCDPSSETYWSM